MRLDWEIARRGYRRYAAYPAATWAGLFTNVFFGFLQAYILRAVYDLRHEVGGYDARDVITYVWLTQGLLSVVASFGPSWYELALRVRSGAVAVDLQRPVDLQRASFAHDAGRAAHQLLYRAIPPFLIGVAFFDVLVPGDAARWLLFAASVALAVVVSFALRFIVNVASFWLLDYRGTTMLALVVNHVFSGLIVPLAFFPNPLDDFVRLLPWAATLQLPIDIFVGHASDAEALGVLAIQAFWAVALLAAGHAALAAGTRKLVLQGG